MNNHTIKMSLLSTLILGSLTLGASEGTVHAAQEVKTRAKVEFKAPDIDDPADPSDPEEEITTPITPDPEINPPVVYPGGPLRINHVPSISFGVNSLSSKTAHYYAQLEKVVNIATQEVTPRASFVEVADLTGEMKGWTVKASSDGIFKSAKGDIKGAITLTNGVVRGLDDMDLHPDKAPAANQSVVLGETPGAVLIMSAEAGKGYNKWQTRYGHSDQTVLGDDETARNPQVMLTVPGGQQILASEEYVANITWVLEQGL